MVVWKAALFQNHDCCHQRQKRHIAIALFGIEEKTVFVTDGYRPCNKKHIWQKMPRCEDTMVDDAVAKAKMVDCGLVSTYLRLRRRCCLIVARTDPRFATGSVCVVNHRCRDSS